MKSPARSTGKFFAALGLVGVIVALVIAGSKELADPASSSDGIMAAVDSGNLKELSRRVNSGESIDVLDGSGRSPIVASIGRPEITEFLIQHGANPNSLLHTGDTLLVRAAERGDIQMIDVLLDHGARIDESTSDGETALISALMSENTAAAQELLKRGANPNVADAVGAMALNYAAGRGLIDVLPDLLRAHAQVNVHTYVGMTPLGRAILNGRDEAAAFLLANGAKPYDKEFSLMDYAALAGAYPLQLEYIIAPRLDYHITPDELRHTENAYSGDGTLAKSRAPALVTLLAKAGYPVNEKGKGSMTPLHFAALADNGDAVAALLRFGADKNARDAKGRTPLDLAREKKCSSAIGALTGHSVAIQ